MFIFILVFTSCIKDTSTPKEFLNSNRVTTKKYNKDKVSIRNAIYSLYDSINVTKTPVQKTNVLDVKIDTIFYSSDNNRLAFLVLLDKENEYIKPVEPNKIGIQYAGECYIAKRINDEIRILDRLKYSVTSKESRKKVKSMIQIFYLKEMNFIESKYNINDIRFWDSNVWIQADLMKKKRENFEEAKKENPNNVHSN